MPSATRNGRHKARRGDEVVPPQALDAERAVLSCVLIDPSRLADVRAIVRPGDMYGTANATIYRRMLTIADGGATVDMTALVESLRAAGEYVPIGGAAYLADVVSAEALVANATHHARTVAEVAARRRIIRDAESLVTDARHGTPLEELRGRAAGLAEDRGLSRVNLPRMTCRELLDHVDQTEFLVPGVMVAGQPMIVAGAKKTLKTSILIDLAISLATGGCFLGSLRAHRAARVLVVSGESGASTLRETALRVADAARVDLAAVERLIWCDSLPRLAEPEQLAALARLIRADQIEVAILDPAYLMLPGDDAGNVFSQGALLGRLGHAVAEAGAMLVLAHHTRKGVADAYAPPELADIAWSGFAEWARQWLLIGRREPYEPGTGEHRLWLSAGGSAGHSGLWSVDIDEGRWSPTERRYWCVAVRTATEARAEERERRQAERTTAQHERLQADTQTLTQALDAHPDGATARKLRDYCGWSGDRASRVLESLVRDGIAEPCDVVADGRRKPQRGYRRCPD